MAVLNKVTFGSGKSFNTGWGHATKAFGPVIGAIAIPKGMGFTKAQIADIQTTLENLCKADNPYQRGYPMGDFIDFTAANNDPKKESLPNGAEKILADGIPTFTAFMVAGDFNNQINLRNFKNAHSIFDFLFYHQNLTLSGTWKMVNGVEMWYGISLMDLWTRSRDFTTFSASEKTQLIMTLKDPTQINEFFGYVEIGFNAMDLPRVTDVLHEVTIGAANAYITVTALEKFTKQDVSGYYSSELADTSCWKLIKEDGTPVTLTGVVAVTGGWKLTPTAALTAGNYIVSLGALSALDAADVTTPYESVGGGTRFTAS